MTDAWGAIFAPAKPARRKTAVAAKPSAKAPGGARKGSPAKPAAKPSAKSKVPSTSTARTTVPKGALFKNGTHESAFGTRCYKMYVPAAAKVAVAPLPLLVMLHGCGQSPQDFASGIGMNALAEEFGFLVLYPAQARRAQVNRCWSWFKRSDQARGAGEPALIASLTRHILAKHAIDPARVYVGGLSAGAAAALILGVGYADIFAAVGAHSGLPIGAAHDAA